MTIFDQREKGFEAKSAADEKARFVIHARQSKLIGLWAARKMGMTAAEAESYAKTVVRVDVEKVGREDVVAKIVADLSDRGVAVDAAEVHREMDSFHLGHLT
jgi:hypothetical protein